jgi:hypothetical protein
MELQQTSTQSMLTTLATQKPQDPLGGLLSLAPVLAPLIKEWMSARSPDRMAEMMSNMTDANLSQLSLLQQFIAPLVESNDNPLASFLQQGVQAMVDIAQKMSAAAKPPPPRQVRVQSTQPGREPQQQQPPQQATRAPRTASRQPEPPVEVSQANYFADMIMGAGNLDPALKTPAWRNVYFALHGDVPAIEVAKEIGTILSSQQQDGTLIADFLPIFQDDSGVAPSDILAPFLMGLPVGAMRPSYVQEVLQAFEDLFGADDDSEQDDEQEAEVVDTREPVTA